MRILLTGASGYVGSEVLIELAAAGHDVTVITRERQRSAHHSTRQIIHDLREPLDLFTDDFELVIHAAGANEVASRDPATALSLTALTTSRVAEFASRQRYPRILYVSTFQVYGTAQGIIDEFTPCKPTSIYGLTHFFAEQWLEHFGRTHGLAWINARVSNVAGMPAKGNMGRWTLVPGCFCESAMREHRIIVQSTELQQRDFLSLNEVARRLVNIAADFDIYANGAVNVCSGVALTVDDIANMAAKRFKVITGHDCEVIFAPRHCSSNRPPTLSIHSRLFEHRAEEKLDEIGAIKLMNTCIDKTYRYLERKTNESKRKIPE